MLNSYRLPCLSFLCFSAGFASPDKASQTMREKEGKRQELHEFRLVYTPKKDTFSGFYVGAQTGIDFMGSTVVGEKAYDQQIRVAVGYQFGFEES